MILLNFVQQGAITHFEQPRRRLAVPVSLLERHRDGVALGFAFDALHQRPQAGAGLLRFYRLHPRACSAAVEHQRVCSSSASQSFPSSLSASSSSSPITR